MAGTPRTRSAPPFQADPDAAVVAARSRRFQLAPATPRSRRESSHLPLSEPATSYAALVGSSSLLFAVEVPSRCSLLYSLTNSLSLSLSKPKLSLSLSAISLSSSPFSLFFFCLFFSLVFQPRMAIILSIYGILKPTDLCLVALWY